MGKASKDGEGAFLYVLGVYVGVETLRLSICIQSVSIQHHITFTSGGYFHTYVNQTKYLIMSAQPEQ